MNNDNYTNEHQLTCKIVPWSHFFSGSATGREVSEVK